MEFIRFFCTLGICVTHLPSLPYFAGKAATMRLAGRVGGSHSPTLGG
jgi:hypothetical protein